MKTLYLQFGWFHALKSAKGLHALSLAGTIFQPFYVYKILSNHLDNVTNVIQLKQNCFSHFLKRLSCIIQKNMQHKHDILYVQMNALYLYTSFSHIMLRENILTHICKLYLKQLCSQAAPPYGTRRVNEGAGGWGSSFVIVLVAVDTKSYYPPLNSPPSTPPPPAEKVIVPRCSDNCWNNNSEINGFYVLSESHFWTAQKRCRDWSCQRFILSSQQNTCKPSNVPLRYMDTLFVKAVWLL